MSVADCASASAAEVAGEGLLEAPPTAIAAFRVADLRARSGRLVAGGSGARVVPAAGQALPVTGESMTFCHPIVTVPAVVTAAGAVLAGGWLPEFVRLGELEAHLGDGVIEDLVERAIADAPDKTGAPPADVAAVDDPASGGDDADARRRIGGGDEAAGRPSGRRAVRATLASPGLQGELPVVPAGPGVSDGGVVLDRGGTAGVRRRGGGGASGEPAGVRRRRDAHQPG